MNFEEQLRIVGKFGLMLTDTDEWYRKYTGHLSSARKRGLVSNLSFEDYLRKVVTADLEAPGQIGKHNGQYQLGRTGDVGDYENDNCRFITSEQNRQEAVENGRFISAAARRSALTKENTEWIRRVAESKIGRTKENDPGRAAQADKLAKEFVLRDPNGVEHRGKNLSEFCQQRGLNPRALYEVFSGRQTHHKGWTGYYPNIQ